MHFLGDVNVCRLIGTRAKIAQEDLAMEPLRFPDHLRYDLAHTWVAADEKRATVGITSFAGNCWGRAEFVQLPEIGQVVTAGQIVGQLHCDLTGPCIITTPVSGKVAEISEALTDEPELATADPYGNGWLFRIDMSDAAELQDLMDAGAYREALNAPKTTDVSSLLAMVFRQSSDAMMLVDRYRRVLAMNPAAEKLTGYGLRDLAGECRCQHMLHCQAGEGSVHGVTCAGVQAFRELAAMKPGTISIERKDQRRVRVSVAYSPIPDPIGGDMYMLITMRGCDG
jgi:glycine cleavage system H protein